MYGKYEVKHPHIKKKRGWEQGCNLQDHFVKDIFCDSLKFSMK